MSGDQWTGSKDSPNFMTLTFNSKFVQDRPAKKGFRLRFNAIEKNGNSYPLSSISGVKFVRWKISSSGRWEVLFSSKVLLNSLLVLHNVICLQCDRF